MSATNEVAPAGINVAEALISCCEPSTLQDAINSENFSQWISAINEEFDLLDENKTWVLIERPKNENVISNRWIFKRKYKADGTIDKYKARLVIRGFAQRAGIDFHEIYAPVIKYNTVRAVFSIAATEDFHMIQFDVKTAFLYGDLEETIFMEQPLRFEIDDRVCLLKKSLYRLKQASGSGINE